MSVAAEYRQHNRTNRADDQEFRAKWLTDVKASFCPAGYLLAIGVQNLFNVFPDRNSTVNSFNGMQTFPSHSPFGMNGRGCMPGSAGPSRGASLVWLQPVT